MTNRWRVFYIEEQKKERAAQKKRQDRQQRAYTKSFKQRQKFGPASDVRVIYPEKTPPPDVQVIYPEKKDDNE